MFDRISINTGLAELVLYFRLIFDQILILNSESVHDHVKRVFGENYDIVMTSATNIHINYVYLRVTIYSLCS